MSQSRERMHIAMETVLGDRERLTMGNYMAERTMRELTSPGQFLDVVVPDTLASVWPLPKEGGGWHYLTFLSSNHRSIAGLRDLQSAFRQKDEELTIVCAEWQSDESIRISDESGNDLQPWLRHVAHCQPFRCWEQPSNGSVDEYAARLSALSMLRTFLGEDGFYTYAAERYVVNHLLAAPGRMLPGDLDRVGLLKNGRIIAIEHKRNSPDPHDDTFSVPLQQAGLYMDFARRLNAMSICVITDMVECRREGRTATPSAIEKWWSDVVRYWTEFDYLHAHGETASKTFPVDPRNEPSGARSERPKWYMTMRRERFVEIRDPMRLSNYVPVAHPYEARFCAA